MKRKRLYEIEFLHSAAFCAVVIQHILGAYSRRGDSLVGVYELSGIAVVFEIVRFAVPLFIFVSGLLLCYNIDSFRYPRFLKRRVGKILLPYLAWTIAYFLYASWYMEGTFPALSASASQIAWMALTGTASYHLWYVVMIFQFVLLSPIFIWVIRRLQRSFYTKKAFCVISAVFVVFCLAILKFEPLVPSDTFFGGLFFVYRTRLFFSYLLFYGLGCICGLYYQTFCQVLLKTAPLVWAAWCIGILFGSFQSLQFIKQTGTLSFSCVSFLNPGFALLTAAAILAVFSLALKLRQREPLSGLVSFIDQNTFEAYLAHAMVLSVLSTRLLTVSANWNLTVFYLLLTILTVPVSLLLAYFLRRLARLFPHR